MTPSYDLIVVGGGVLGAFHAFHALRAGYRVLLLERDAAPMQASVRNFGQVVPSGLAPGRWFGFGREGLALYHDLHRAGVPGIRIEGSLYVASDEAESGLLDEAADAFAAEGYPAQRLTASACRRHVPSMRADYARDGLFFPDEVTVDARALVPNLLAYLVEQHGLDYRPMHPVVACETAGGGVTLTVAGGQTFAAAHAVLCTGHEVKLLLPDVLRAADLVVTKLQMLETEPLADVRLPGNLLTGLTIRRYERFQTLPSYGRLTRDHLDPRVAEWGVHLLFKRTDEGTIVFGDSHEYATAHEADALGFDVRADVNAFLTDEARRILDLPFERLRRTWFGVYSQTRTGDVFTHAVADCLHVATGIGGKGMTASGGFARAHLDTFLPLSR